MSKSYKSEAEKFHRELDFYRATARSNKPRLEDNPFLEKQITFWIEGTRFFISELEIWDQLRDAEECEKTIHKIQEALDRMQRLIDQLVE